MKVIQRKEMDEPQPAIDTLCDNCGAIYDLFDCTTCLCGRVLCPDCYCESLPQKKLPPGRSGLHHYGIIRMYDPQNSAFQIRNEIHVIKEEMAKKSVFICYQRSKVESEVIYPIFKN